MLMTIKSVVILVILALGILACVFMAGQGLGKLQMAVLAQERVHAVDFYPVDPEVNSNLSLIRPYIQLCMQSGGAWMWQVTVHGTINGACTEGVEVQGDPHNDEEDIEEAKDTNDGEVRPY